MTDDVEPRKKPLDCDSCHFCTKRLKRYGRPDKWLCDLCANTLAGNALEYPAQYRDVNTLRTICYVGNVLLAAIAERHDR